METIINSLPESLSTAILTGIFTGLLLFYFQKKMENSFAEKMEAFKSNLQMSLFEHQTKFVRNHQKRVEALETLYVKYRAVAEYFYEVLNAREGDSFNLYPTQVDDFRNYYSYSRLYLSENEIIEVDDIFDGLRYLIMITRIKYGSEAYSLEKIIRTNEVIRECGLQITPLDLVNPNKQLLDDELYRESTKQQERFIKLYSSIANAKSNK